MNKEEFCDTCEHSIDFHRFLKSAKPDACIAIIKTEKGEEYCKCNKFVSTKSKKKKD